MTENERLGAVWFGIVFAVLTASVLLIARWHPLPLALAGLFFSLWIAGIVAILGILMYFGNDEAEKKSVTNAMEITRTAIIACVFPAANFFSILWRRWYGM